MHGFVASNPRGKSFNFASKRVMIFGAIGPRSRCDRALIFVLVDCRLSSGRLEAIPPLKECNRRLIAMRSWCDHGSIAPQSRRSPRKLLYPPI